MYDGRKEEADARGADGAEGAAAEVCPACGAPRGRAGARFCATCGRALGGGGYVPSDALRASYHLQGRSGAAALAGGVRPSGARPRPTTAPERGAPADLFLHNRNGASTTALAFVTYSLVPYLGILFCPGALLLGGIGLVRARRSPHLGGGRASAMSIAYGVLILGVQIFLWWILYKVPEWSRQSPWMF